MQGWSGLRQRLTPKVWRFSKSPHPWCSSDDAVPIPSMDSSALVLRGVWNYRLQARRWLPQEARQRQPGSAEARASSPPPPPPQPLAAWLA